MVHERASTFQSALRILVGIGFIVNLQRSSTREKMTADGRTQHRELLIRKEVDIVGGVDGLRHSVDLMGD